VSKGRPTKRYLLKIKLGKEYRYTGVWAKDSRAAKALARKLMASPEGLRTFRHPYGVEG
jgi:hypothetical protein